GPRGLVSLRAGDGDLLVETRQRIREPARKPQRPAEKDPFAVVDVVQKLTNGPLVRLVTMRRLFLGNVFQKRQRLIHLIVEIRNDVVSVSQIDVAKVIGG